jgi:hypothetical protein
MKERGVPWSVLLVASLLVLLFALGIAVLAETPQPETTPESTIGDETPTEDEAPTGETPAPTATALLEGVIETRTPVPTATPGLISEEVERFARTTGLYRATFLGLSGTDWINLGVSILIVLVGYAIGTVLIRGVLSKAVRRTPYTLDDNLLQAIGPNLSLFFAPFKPNREQASLAE